MQASVQLFHVQCILWVLSLAMGLSLSLWKAIFSLNNSLGCLMIFICYPWPTTQLKVTLVLPLYALPGYKRWLVESLYPLLLGVFTRITFLHRFHCTGFLPYPTSVLQFLLFPLHSPFISHPIPNQNSPVTIPTLLSL